MENLNLINGNVTNILQDNSDIHIDVDINQLCVNSSSTAKFISYGSAEPTASTSGLIYIKI